MKRLGSFWQKLIIWLTGYVNIIAFVLGAGYIYTKSEDDEIKCSAKLSLICVAGFTILNMFYTLLYNFLVAIGSDYEIIEGIAIISNIFTIAKIIVFVVLATLDIMGELNRVKAKLRDPDTKTEAEEE